MVKKSCHLEFEEKFKKQKDSAAAAWFFFRFIFIFHSLIIITILPLINVHGSMQKIKFSCYFIYIDIERGINYAIFLVFE